jgi:hypothetical protein
MTQEQYLLAKNIIKVVLEELLQTSEDEITIARYLYMFWTGVETTTKDGKTQNVYPVGPFLKRLIVAMNQKKDSQISEENPIKEIRFTGQHTKYLLKQALSESVAWEAVKMLAAKIYEQGDELPKDLKEFIFKTLNSSGPIKKRGPPKIKKMHRNTCIIMLINELERVGILHPTKSSAYSETFSICDAISEVLHDLGIPLDYDGVKSIYEKRNKIQKNVSPFRLDISEKGAIYIGYSF